MKLFIRADASTQIGSGHVMRCLTLADELKQWETETSFICRKESGNLIRLIETKGFKVYSLPAGIDVESDRELTQNILKKQTIFPDWFIIDHYELDISYESSLRQIVKNIMVIDDIANRQHDCDLLLDQNYCLNRNRYKRLTPQHCTQLLGPQYVLLRPQFRETRKDLKKCHPERKLGRRRLFVFLGGSDPGNVTYKVLRAIQMFETPDIAVDVVIGSSNPHRCEVETLISLMPCATCHVQVENMAELMATADIGVGAAGITTWERCCVGLPSIVIILAENQRKVAETLDKSRVVINLGWHETLTESDLKKAIEKLIKNTEVRTMMSIKSQEIVDGRGTERVIAKMMAKQEKFYEAFDSSQG
jgi:UDP-2,4-diacetamido-2,4,6-trideoxy-beta-L-altropyranose hydrolase